MKEYNLNESVPTFAVIDKASGDEVQVDERTFDPEQHERIEQSAPKKKSKKGE